MAGLKHRPDDPVLAACVDLRRRIEDLALGGRFTQATQAALFSATFAVDRARKEETRMAGRTDEAHLRNALDRLWLAVQLLADRLAPGSMGDDVPELAAHLRAARADIDAVRVKGESRRKPAEEAN